MEGELLSALILTLYVISILIRFEHREYPVNIRVKICWIWNSKYMVKAKASQY